MDNTEKITILPMVPIFHDYITCGAMKTMTDEEKGIMLMALYEYGMYGELREYESKIKNDRFLYSIYCEYEKNHDIADKKYEQRNRNGKIKYIMESQNVDKATAIKIYEESKNKSNNKSKSKSNNKSNDNSTTTQKKYDITVEVDNEDDDFDDDETETKEAVILKTNIEVYNQNFELIYEEANYNNVPTASIIENIFGKKATSTTINTITKKIENGNKNLWKYTLKDY